MEDFDMVDWIMRYEAGEMGETETIAGFQVMINSGLVWRLQGHYGRMATVLIDAGYCTPAVRRASN